MIIVVSSATAMVAATVANDAITDRFESYLRLDEQRYELQSRLFQALAAEFLSLYYSARGEWPSNITDLVVSLSNVIGYRVVLEDVNGTVIVDTSQHTRSRLQINASPHIGYKGDLVASVYVQVPAPKPDSREETAFINSVGRSLIIGVILSASASILLTVILTHPMLRTLEALTARARQMAQRSPESESVHKAETLVAQPPARLWFSLRARSEVGQLAHWFSQMSEALARAELLRRNMVSDIAHELRTPLSNIRGYMEGLRDGVIPPDASLFDALHEQAMILNRLVGDLQELALAEAGQLHLVQQPSRIQDIVQRAVNILQAEASRHGVALAADIPHDLPLVYADSERVGQMLMNLLKNAVMYTPSGGHVIIQAHATGDKITVAVRDTGQGIPMDILPHVFERFYRVDRSRTRATGGSGLGLAIVKQLAQAQGGDVWAESTPGRGSTFAFTLPRA